jgi:hypothetical protein
MVKQRGGFSGFRKWTQRHRGDAETQRETRRRRGKRGDAEGGCGDTEDTPLCLCVPLRVSASPSVSLRFCVPLDYEAYSNYRSQWKPR